jgi:anti-sigma factor RsiW
MKIFDRNHQNPPPDPLDDLLAAAIFGELTPEERAQLELRLQTDPAARAAYQETLHMHDLLEKSYRDAQPDPAFEERMVSGVRRKLRDEKEHRETAWESAVVLWRGMRGVLTNRWVSRFAYAGVFVLVAALAFQGYVRTNGRLLTGMSIAPNSEKSVAAFAEETSAPTHAQALDGIAETNAAPMAAPPAAPSVASEAPTPQAQPTTITSSSSDLKRVIDDQGSSYVATAQKAQVISGYVDSSYAGQFAGKLAPMVTTQNGAQQSVDKVQEMPYPTSAVSQLQIAPPVSAATPEPTRKLVRNASLDLEVKNFQTTVDALTASVNAGGGYVDSSNSQRGGNGKLQGTIVVKVLPEKLDAFLLKLRDLGEIKNQSVSTEDVTKAYYDTQARLGNAQRMEAQLQELLKRDTDHVSELLQVERELGRVRGEIEQMQGELKLYDFQVQYATVTIAVQEKELNQAAAYLLKESDEFSLFAPDVETAFAQARQAADAFKGQVLSANLDHNSGSDISATLAISVPPDQIEGFLAQVKTLGRLDNFTRQTERVANDGGDSDQPADETKTEKDRVMVNLSIHADDATAQEQTQLSVVTGDDVDAQAQAAKQDAAKVGAAVTASSFARETDGTETADLSFRLPLGQVAAFTDTLKSLGRVESLSIHRDDQPGATPAGPDAPADISLHLHNEAAIVADDSGLWPTLRRTFGEGIAAFLDSVQTIGVVLAFVLPWLVALVVAAWIGRRVYVMRKR